MSLERLTDEGPKGREATFAAGETPHGIRAQHESESELPPGANDL